MDGNNQRQSAGPAKLVIVGGGAAGMFAAAVAAERHIPCVVIERKARLGSKVLMTANGRCNFAKDILPEQFLNDISRGGIAARCAEFVAEAVRECPPRQICRGFQSLGVRTKRMTDGRFFPADEKAATIVHAFGDLLRDEEVPIVTNCPVKEIAAVKGGAARFAVVANSFSILAENVLLATGGVSYPKTGSVGDGQRFAQALGHKLVPYRPGLIGLETRDEKVTRLAGRRFEDRQGGLRVSRRNRLRALRALRRGDLQRTAVHRALDAREGRGGTAHSRSLLRARDGQARQPAASSAQGGDRDAWRR